MQAILGNRKIVLARELTKKFEEFLRGTIEEALEWATESEIRGEFVVIVEGADESVVEEETTWWSTLTVVEHIEQLIERGQSSKDAIKEVSKERKLPKRDVYQAYHIE